MEADMIRCPVSGETPTEERINTLTHLAGLCLSIVGTIILVLYAKDAHDPGHLLSCSIYGATLVLLYAASTYYHACSEPSQKRVLRVIDHACIYLLIAGTYTPYSLGPLKAAEGWNLLWIEWGIALVGIAIKVLALNRFQAFSMIAYLAMGWLVIFNLPMLIEQLPFSAIFWLVTGGIIYSLGTLFYLWDSLPFNHAIWHLFVLGGSVCHYCSILHMVQHASSA